MKTERWVQTSGSEVRREVLLGTITSCMRWKGGDLPFTVIRSMIVLKNNRLGRISAGGSTM